MTKIKEVCEFDGKIVKPCYDLEFVSNIGILKNGVLRYEYVKGVKREISRVVYAIKSGQTGSTGQVMEYCPFCGVNIYQDNTNKDKAE